MGLFSDPRVEMLMQQVSMLSQRIQNLEANARYTADQPSMQYYSLFSQCNPDANVVPINEVVKAIVKHLDMQIEKVAEQTTKSPQEVRVVEKPKMMVSPTGIVVMPDGSGIPMPKGKTAVKRKVVKPAVKKTTRRSK